MRIQSISLIALAIALCSSPVLAEESAQDGNMQAIFSNKPVKMAAVRHKQKAIQQEDNQVSAIYNDENPMFPSYAVIGSGNGRSSRDMASVTPDISMDPKFAKQEVEFQTKEPAGTVIISTNERMLYYVLGDGKALRYGVGVGRPGFEWAGVKTVSRKAEWPDWRPPVEMLQRRPDLPRFMPGGPDNPLGARAMYLGSSLYRIHGTNEDFSIGTAVSSGCIRMRNDDVSDLYSRVKLGAKVVVL